ncbi:MULTISPECIES: hypothetical protein [unclassified Sphingomonas]|uniref:hypothetical protein n=1 Tax=unclassified Sphingomonas TaxID=196159 RepID=UPI0022698941|nr:MULTISPECIES: hypothetical protein [unclassified Sphingomonas]
MTVKEIATAGVKDTRPEPFDKEKLRMAEARERWVDRTPPVQVAFPEDGTRTIRAPHNDDSGHTMRLGDTFGTRSQEFLAIQLTELSAAVRTRGHRDATAQQLNAGIAFVAAVAPQDELEAALAVQMAGCHFLATDLIGRAVGADNLAHAQAFGNLAVKMQRTFTAQIEALGRMRGKGQQTIRVEHVTVEAGAQAIVGDVHHHGSGRGGYHQQSKGQPHATSEPTERAALLSPDPLGNGVPVPGDAERPVSAPRGPKPRRSARKQERVQARPVQP